MKKYLLFAIIAGMLSSCAFATVETKGKDSTGGATCKATYVSGFKSLTEVKMTACGAGGEAGTSNVDPAAAVLMKIVIDALAAKAAPIPLPSAVPGVVTP